MKARHFVIGCLVVFVGLVAMLGVGGYVFYTQVIGSMDYEPPQQPEALKQPGITVGATTLSSDVFADVSQLGNLTDLQIDVFLSGPRPVIAAVAREGVVFLELDGSRISRVRFSGYLGHVDLVFASDPRDFGFINRGSWGNNSSLLGGKGGQLWDYGGFPGTNDMSAADVDGDGRLEFAVGFNGGGGIHFVDANGKKIWKQPGGNIWHVEIVEATGAGTYRIVHSNAGGELTVRDTNGQILSQSKPPAYFSDFSMIPWPETGDPPHAVFSEDDKIWVLALDGAVAAEYDAPESGSLGEVHSVLAKLEADQPEYFAAIVDFRNWDRSILYVYDPFGVLVYSEVLGESSRAIAKLTDLDTGLDIILVGGKGRILSYSLAPSTPMLGQSVIEPDASN